KGLPGAVRDAHPQAAHRRPGAHLQDRGCADAPQRPGRCRYRNQAMIQALLGRKLGMTRIFDENGVVTASTLVEAGPCFITQLKTSDVDGYVAVQLGFGTKPRQSKPKQGHLKKAGLPDRQGLEELREVSADSMEDR